ncbi:hypothetical protein [Methylobacterium sp. Leaf466]|uniref:hypothetical protein n=1 Tax=Methylobacterium sp. Leaf466 TaxID=1736386 RepID=UPI0006F6059F|nr:hypothetical protein [Methylobacterium sp. Leaf466]KQT82432.1 hypothetical protein ASG59_18745 [Methylobacterium sp. Leaf466]
MNQRVVDSENRHQIDLVNWQYVPDEFYEENARMREASKMFPVGEMHMYARPPVHTWEVLKSKFPGLGLDTPVKGIEAAKERANEVMKCLRAMGEERCITTVHRF